MSKTTRGRSRTNIFSSIGNEQYEFVASHPGAHFIRPANSSKTTCNETKDAIALRVTEPVIKFITVRIDEEQKRLDKIKAIRDARRKTPPPSPATPAPAAEAGGETPAATA